VGAVKKWAMKQNFYSGLKIFLLLFACSSFFACQENNEPILCATEPYSGFSDYLIGSLENSSDDIWSFITQPNLQPMKVDVLTQEAGLGEGLIFVSPYNPGTVVGQTGALILDNEGNPVWFRPLSSSNLQNMNFQAQTYQGQTVLTFWQGTLAIPPNYTNLPAGLSEPGSCYYILDNQYRVLKTLTAQRDYTSDEHEFILTSRGTALFTSIKSVAQDLSPYGGPENGYIADCAIQEVDLQTGDLLFFWSFLEHVDPADSKVAASSATSSGNVWDAFHCNSIDEGPDGDILISARNLWAIYHVQKSNGEILWQLGGVKSDFSFAPNAQFYWQHDARFLPDGKISLFDDGCCDTNTAPEQESHGLILNLHFSPNLATADRHYYHAPALFSNSQGNMQTLSNGNRFVGWGSSSYYSEYAAAGNTPGNGSENLLYDVQMPGGNISYRAFRKFWIGLPDYLPSIALQSTNGQTNVYASWNGSTQTAAWQVLAGQSANDLSVLVPNVSKDGFETTIPIASQALFFQVKALDSIGNILGVSEVIQR